MISLRHHIFSLVAVFVALAIGIAAGSTVVRGPLLDSLRARVESAEALIETERAENDSLAAEVAQLDQLGEDAPDQLLRDRLSGTSVLLVVAGAVDVTVVDGISRSLTAASAELIGEIRIDPSAFDPDESARIATAIGAPAGSNVAEELGTHLAGLLTRVKAGVEARGSISGVASSVFGALEDEGVVDLLRLRREAVDVDTFDVVLLDDRNVDDDPGPVLRAMVDGVLRASETDAAGTHPPVMIVAEVGRLAADDDATSPSFVFAVRDSGRLRDEVSTVDNAETVLGWIATVLALQSAQNGEVGHYGFREGAQRSIPELTP
jgi:hypothetical protein